MNKADTLYVDQARAILKEELVKETRAEWETGIKAGAKVAFVTVSRYDLSKEFPIMSLRKQLWKNAIEEIFWIHQKFSNNIKDLNSKIWNQWADENGSIGTAYGYQAGKKYKWDDVPFECTQIERVFYLLKNEPSSRRMYITLRNPAEAINKRLDECAHTVEFTVKNNKLNMVLLQRSGDYLTASSPGSWNEIQYATLQLAIAHCTGLEPGEFVHTVTNHHIYDRHEEQVKELINLYEKTFKKIENGEIFDKFPKLIIKTEEKDFFKLKPEDFEIINYEPLSIVKNIKVAK